MTLDKAEIRKKFAEIGTKLSELELQHRRAIAASDDEQVQRIQKKMSDLIRQKEKLQAKLSA
jgi:hypothetical protein